MKTIKSSFEGNPFVGLFARATDDYVIIPSSTTPKFENAAKVISAKVIKTSISSSPYIGMYCVANRHGALVAPFCTQKEIENITNQGIHVDIFKDYKFCAVGNNIACNDKVAIVNEQMPAKNIEMIEHALQVETIAMKICQYYTVGMMIAVTNKGFLVHNRVEQKQMDELKDILGMQGINTTVNSATPIVGLGVVANSNAAIIGEATTGYEMSRIEQGLELIE